MLEKPSYDPTDERWIKIKILTQWSREGLKWGCLHCMLRKYQGVAGLSLSTCLRNRLAGPHIYDPLFQKRNYLRLQVDYKQKNKPEVQALASEVTNWRYLNIGTYQRQKPWDSWQFGVSVTAAGQGPTPGMQGD